MAGFLRSLDPHSSVSFLILVASAGATLSCGAPGKPVARDGVVPSYDAQTGRLEQISYDRNKNGKPDAWLFMDGSKVTRAELDENDDGVVDRWEHYGTNAPSTSGPIPRGELVRAEQDTRFEGKVSRWEKYEGGRLATVEEDASGDGRPDKWETWTAGTLSEVALDTRGRGKPDRRIVYPADGSAPQMLVDEAGDGTFRPVDSQS
jgi:hypothetical protein